MIERFQELLARPGMPEILTKLLGREEREREAKKDKERWALLSERDALYDELALGRAAMLSAVKDADVEVARAKAAFRTAVQKKREAERALQNCTFPIERRLGKIESEILKRPIAFIGPLRARLADAKRALGASRWTNEKEIDPLFWRRAERLSSIEREVDALETKDSVAAETATPRIERSIESALT
jgi:hypothetical protein